eukprot:773934-Pyramimonas_sp.AAC.1
MAARPFFLARQKDVAADATRRADLSPIQCYERALADGLQDARARIEAQGARACSCLLCPPIQ